MKTPRYLAAQFGSHDERRKATTLVLSSSDLSGEGWYVAKTLSWRVGFIGERDEYTARARSAGLFGAERTIKKVHSDLQVRINVSTLVSSADAQASLITVCSYVARLPAIRAMPVDAIPGATSLDDENRLFCFEQIMRDKTQQTTSRYVVGVEACVVFVVVCISKGEAWVWKDVAALVEIQALKIRNS